MYILIVGNVVDGLEFYGPFKSNDEAILYAEGSSLEDWWIAPLNQIDEEEHAFKCLQCGLGYNMTEDESEDGCPECGQILIWDTDVPLYDENS